MPSGVLGTGLAILGQHGSSLVLLAALRGRRRSWRRRGRRRRRRARCRNLDYRSVGTGLRCGRRRNELWRWRQRRRWRIATERRLGAKPEGPAIVVGAQRDRRCADIIMQVPIEQIMRVGSEREVLGQVHGQRAIERAVIALPNLHPAVETALELGTVGIGQLGR